MGLFSNTANVVAQTGDPGPLGPGSLWSETDAQILWRRNDANTAWVDVSTGFYGSSVSSKGTLMPSSPDENDLFYHTDLKHFFVFDGTNWKSKITGDVITAFVENNLSVDDGWAAVDTGQMDYNATTDLIDFDIVEDNSNDAISIPLVTLGAAAQTNDPISIEFELKLNTITDGSSGLLCWIILSNNTSASTSEVNHNALGLEMFVGAGTDRFSSVFVDTGTLINGTTSDFSVSPATGTFIMRFEFSNQENLFTILKLDSSRQLIQKKEIDTSALSLASLDNFGIWNRTISDAGTSAIIGTVDNIKVFNGLSRF